MEQTAAKSVQPIRMQRPTFDRVGSFSFQNAAIGTMPKTTSVKAVKASTTSQQLATVFSLSSTAMNSHPTKYEYLETVPT